MQSQVLEHAVWLSLPAKTCLSTLVAEGTYIKGILFTVNNLGVGSIRNVWVVLVLTLTIGRWDSRSVSRGCWGSRWSLSRGWSVIVVCSSKDIHATGRAGLLSLEPGAQAAVVKKGRKMATFKDMHYQKISHTNSFSV